jgi:predicted MFS family arabinose efflux permease
VEYRDLTAAAAGRNVRLAVFAHAISVLGDRMVAVALAFAALEVGGGAAGVGLVLASASVASVGTVLLGGVIADRLPRRRIMVTADLVRVGTQGAMAVLLLTGDAELWMLAALAGCSGIATGFFNPAVTGLLPSFVDAADLQRVNGLRATAVSVGEIAGPALAGVLVAAFGAGVAIGVDALTFACSAVALVALRLSPEPGRERAGSFVADLRDGWTAFSSRRWVWTFVVYFGVSNLMWGAWAALGPVIAARSLGGAQAWGLILSVMGAGTLVGGAIATRVDPRRPLIAVALAEGAFALPLAGLAVGGPSVLIAAAAFASGAGMMIGMSVWESTLQRQIPADAISRVSSYDWFGSYAAYPIGLALWAPIAAITGVQTALWAAFGLMALAIAALLWLPDTRRLPREPAISELVEA